MIDKALCDKVFIWNPGNCECQCDKFCDIDGVKVDNKNENKHKCSSSTVYIVLFSIILAINIGIGIYFVYCKYMSHDEKNVSKYDYVYQTTI